MSGQRRRTRCKACRQLSHHVYAGRCRTCREQGAPRTPPPAPTRHTVTQFLSMTDALEVSGRAAATEQSHTCPASASWDRDAGWEGAQQLARHGWTEPRAEVGALTSAISGELRELVREAVTPVMEVAGGEVDVDVFTTGEPECMRDYQLTPESAQREVVTILVGVSASCRVTADTIMRRGAAVCALVDLVARAGYTVEIWTDNTVESGNSLLTQQVRIHDPAALLDVDQVMYALAHPAMLRRTVFGLMEHEPASVRNAIGVTTHGGYGKPREPAADKLPHAPTITLGTVHSGDFHDVPSSVRWVRQQLASLGILGTP